MRPVNKPPPPQGPAQFLPPLDGLTLLRMQLQDTIGYYCAFCEMPITVTQAVVSKRTRRLMRTPTLADWSDLLLACDFCQLYRTADVADPSQYIWPDTDATFSFGLDSPFLYVLKNVTCTVIKDPDDPRAGEPLLSRTQPLVIVSANLASPDYTRAQNTIDLFQLNTPFYDAKANTYILTESAYQSQIDPRLEQRSTGWAVAAEGIAAMREAQALRDYPFYFENMVKMVAALAQATGFWSVWMTAVWQAFADPEILRALLLMTEQRDGYQVIGYQTVPDGGSPPWTIFTGTALSRVKV